MLCWFYCIRDERIDNRRAPNAMIGARSSSGQHVSDHVGVREVYCKVAAGVEEIAASRDDTSVKLQLD